MADKYVLVNTNTGEIIEYRDYAPNIDQTLLAPGKPRMLKVVEVNANYNPDTEVRTGPDLVLTDTEAKHIYTVRPKNANEVDSMRNLKLKRLRDEYLSRVEDVIPDDKKFLMIVSGFEGILIHGLDRTTWPNALKNVFNPIFSKATNEVKALTQTYLTKEAEIKVLTTASQIANYDVEVGW